MRDSGGHGGSSYPEINVPLIFLGPSCTHENSSYNQIDIPATLSVLFGLPIPASSIGVLIPSLLTGLSMEQKLFAYYYNGERLLQKLFKLDSARKYDDEGENGHSIDEEYFAPSKQPILILKILLLEFFARFIIAKNAHKKFLQSIPNSTEQIQVFESAERSYITASKEMSDKLADSYVNFDHICISIGLVCLVTVCKQKNLYVDILVS